MNSKKLNPVRWVVRTGQGVLVACKTRAAARKYGSPVKAVLANEKAKGSLLGWLEKSAADLDGISLIPSRSEARFIQVKGTPFKVIKVQ